MPVLNLTDYEESNFDAIPPGKYFASIYEIEERETQGGPDAKMPEGTPMIWVHFLIEGKVGEDEGPNEDSPYYGKHAFRNMVIPPEDYGDKKAMKAMNGMIVSFFKSLGVSEETITNGEWEPDLNEYVENKLVIQLNRRPNKMTGELSNNVVSFKNIEEIEGASTGLL
jgi:hypothetical protein